MRPFAVCSSLVLTLAVGAAAFAGCKSDKSETVGAAQITGAPVYLGRFPAETGTLRVQVLGDRDLFLIESPPELARPIVVLGEACESARDLLGAWGGNAAREHGTVIVLSGDVDCTDGTSEWSADIEKLDGRIDRALRAVGSARGRTFHLDDLTLVGIGQGSQRAEELVRQFPKRYTRIVLVNAPQAPASDVFKSARAVAAVIREGETRDLVTARSKALQSTGKPVQMWIVPHDDDHEETRAYLAALTFVEER